MVCSFEQEKVVKDFYYYRFFFLIPLACHCTSVSFINGFSSICVRKTRTVSNTNPLSSKNPYIFHFKDSSLCQIHQHEGEQRYWISILGISGILEVARNLGKVCLILLSYLCKFGASLLKSKKLHSDYLQQMAGESDSNDWHFKLCLSK